MAEALRGRGFPEDSPILDVETLNDPCLGRTPMSESRNPLFRLIDRLSQISGYLAALSILAATLIIVQQVLVRYVLRSPTIWQVETAVYLLIAATFLGAPYGLKENAHINIDMFLMHMSPGARRKLDIFTSTVAMLFCFFLAYRGAVMWWEAYEGNWRSSSLLSVPLIYPYALIPVGMFLTGLQYIVRWTAIFFPPK
jgi:TRAP-type C4-dicarboxylate transport system permease small subunit